MRLLSHMVVLFLVFLRNLHSGLHSVCISLHSLFSTNSPAFVNFLMAPILTGMRWYLIVVLIFISLKMSDVEHLFICLLSICLSLEKYMLSSLARFLIGSFVFLVLNCKSCLHIFQINSWSFVSFAIIFSNSEDCLFTLLIVSFIVQKFLSLLGPICLFLFLFPLLWEVGHRRSCCLLCKRMFCLCFTLRVL